MQRLCCCFSFVYLTEEGRWANQQHETEKPIAPPVLFGYLHYIWLVCRVQNLLLIKHAKQDRNNTLRNIYKNVEILKFSKLKDYIYV